MRNLIPGQIVSSIAGRDNGRHYIVVKVDSPDEVWVADGKYRTLERPKRKKAKHLQKQNVIIHDLNEKLTQGEKVYDSALREVLKRFMRSTEADNGEGGAPGGEERCN